MSNNSGKVYYLALGLLLVVTLAVLLLAQWNESDGARPHTPHAPARRPAVDVRPCINETTPASPAARPAPGTNTTAGETPDSGAEDATAPAATNTTATATMCCPGAEELSFSCYRLHRYALPHHREPEIAPGSVFHPYAITAAEAVGPPSACMQPPPVCIANEAVRTEVLTRGLQPYCALSNQEGCTIHHKIYNEWRHLYPMPRGLPVNLTGLCRGALGDRWQANEQRDPVRIACVASDAPTESSSSSSDPPTQAAATATTDLRTHWTAERGFWSAFLGATAEDDAFVAMQQQANALQLTLNGVPDPAADPIPIWIPTYRRSIALTLRGVCDQDNINETLLVVTVDGPGFGPILTDLLACTCAPIRVFWHVKRATDEAFRLEDPKWLTHVQNSHLVFGLWATMDLLGYDWVIRLEDDELAFRDMYNFYRAARRVASVRSEVVGAMSEPTGLGYYCRFMVSERMCGRSVADPSHPLRQAPPPQGGWCSLTRVMLATQHLNGHVLMFSRRMFHRWLEVWRQPMHADAGKRGGHIWEATLGFYLLEMEERILMPPVMKSFTLPNQGAHGGTGLDPRQDAANMPVCPYPNDPLDYEVLDVAGDA